MSTPAPSPRATRIADLLSVLNPTQFDLRDESHLHAGHNPDAAHGETHYRLTICSAQFSGLSRLAQHRRVMDLLQPEFDVGLHALALITKAE